MGLGASSGGVGGCRCVSMVVVVSLLSQAGRPSCCDSLEQLINDGWRPALNKPVNGVRAAVLTE